MPVKDLCVYKKVCNVRLDGGLSGCWSPAVASSMAASPGGWPLLTGVEPASYLIRVISQALSSSRSLGSIPDMSAE